MAHRYYFLTRPRGRKGRLVPISNAIGAVDRANRQYALNLTRDNVADYLNFYFAFTPKEDPMLSRMPAAAAHRSSRCRARLQTSQSRSEHDRRRFRPAGLQ